MAVKAIDSRRLFEAASNLLQAGKPSVSFAIWQTAEDRIINIGTQVMANDRRPMARVVKAYADVTAEMDKTESDDVRYEKFKEARSRMVCELRQAVKTFRMSAPDIRDREADSSFDRLIDEVMDIEEEEAVSSEGVMRPR
jgi:hypothetical protein